ncbi:Ral GTPase-activating protein subunit alpha/beta N-terminal domain-containing protein [Entamoeba marina]
MFLDTIAALGLLKHNKNQNILGIFNHFIQSSFSSQIATFAVDDIAKFSQSITTENHLDFILECCGYCFNLPLDSQLTMQQVFMLYNTWITQPETRPQPLKDDFQIYQDLLLRHLTLLFAVRLGSETQIRSHMNLCIQTIHLFETVVPTLEKESLSDMVRLLVGMTESLCSSIISSSTIQNDVHVVAEQMIVLTNRVWLLANINDKTLERVMRECHKKWSTLICSMKGWEETILLLQSSMLESTDKNEQNSTLKLLNKEVVLDVSIITKIFLTRLHAFSPLDVDSNVFTAGLTVIGKAIEMMVSHKKISDGNTALRIYDSCLKAAICGVDHINFEGGVIEAMKSIVNIISSKTVFTRQNKLLLLQLFSYCLTSKSNNVIKQTLLLTPLVLDSIPEYGVYLTRTLFMVIKQCLISTEKPLIESRQIIVSIMQRIISIPLVNDSPLLPMSPNQPTGQPLTQIIPDILSTFLSSERITTTRMQVEEICIRYITEYLPHNCGTFEVETSQLEPPKDVGSFCYYVLRLFRVSPHFFENECLTRMIEMLRTIHNYIEFVPAPQRWWQETVDGILHLISNWKRAKSLKSISQSLSLLRCLLSKNRKWIDYDFLHRIHVMLEAMLHSNYASALPPRKDVNVGDAETFKASVIAFSKSMTYIEANAQIDDIIGSAVNEKNFIKLLKKNNIKNPREHIKVFSVGDAIVSVVNCCDKFYILRRDGIGSLCYCLTKQQMESIVTKEYTTTADPVEIQKPIAYDMDGTISTDIVSIPEITGTHNSISAKHIEREAITDIDQLVYKEFFGATITRGNSRGQWKPLKKECLEDVFALDQIGSRRRVVIKIESSQRSKELIKTISDMATLRNVDGHLGGFDSDEVLYLQDEEIETTPFLNGNETNLNVVSLGNGMYKLSAIEPFGRWLMCNCLQFGRTLNGGFLNAITERQTKINSVVEKYLEYNNSIIPLLFDNLELDVEKNDADLIASSTNFHIPKLTDKLSSTDRWNEVAKDMRVSVKKAYKLFSNKDINEESVQKDDIKVKNTFSDDKEQIKTNILSRTVPTPEPVSFINQTPEKIESHSAKLNDSKEKDKIREKVGEIDIKEKEKEKTHVIEKSTERLQLNEDIIKKGKERKEKKSEGKGESKKEKKDKKIRVQRKR